MADQEKTKTQLIAEIEELRRRIAELEKASEGNERAEENVRKWAYIFEHAEWGISVGNGDTLEMINPAYARMHGYTVDELIGQPISTVYAPDSLLKRPEWIREVEEKGHLVFEANHLRKDGTIFPVQVDVSAVRDENGKVLYRAATLQDLSWRKKGEEERRRLMKEIRLLLESTYEGILGVDAEGRCTFVNKAGAAMLGYLPEEMTGRTLHLLIHHSYADGSPYPFEECPLYQTLRQGQKFYSDNELIWRKDGISFPIEYSSFPILEDGSVRGAVITLVDITERKRAESNLSQTQYFLQRILNTTPNLIYIYDLINQINVYTNREIFKILGYRQDEIQAMGSLLFQNLLHLEDADRVAQHHTRLSTLNDDTVLEVEYRMQDAQGRWRWLRSRDILFARNKQGEPWQILGSAEDITERKEAEVLLRRNEERQKNLIQNNFDLIFETDHFGTIKAVSPQSEEVFGVKPEEMIGRHFRIFIKPKDQDRVAALFQKAIVGEEVGTIHFLGEKAEGGELHCELRYVVERVDGRAIGTFGVIRDLSERRMMQAQLQQAQKMEAIGTLAGGIAHDFNNILGIILGCAELSLMKLPDENPVYPHLKQIMQAGTRARDLVRQILTFSRRSEEDRKPIAPGIIVKEALKMLRASLPSTIRIEQSIETDLGMVMADPTQIHQILMNLCTNSAQAMQERGGVLTVDLSKIFIEKGETGPAQTLRPGPYLKLTVSDTGQGIEPQILPRIFDPYFTTKGLGNGTGLGLAVVYGIVKSYKGDITVHSSPQFGTTFDVFLPRLLEIEADRQPPKPQPIPGGKERILVVDDEEALVYTLRNRLHDLGYEVYSYLNSREALTFFEKDPLGIDAVITDMTMPDLTGAELAKRIFRLRPEMPIILCTGYNETINEQTAEALGIRAFLFKPVLLDDLARALRKVLDKG